MRIINGYKGVKNKIKNPVVTIGNFDGVHIGHQEILKTLLNEKVKIGGTGVVYTFTPHPENFLRPKTFLGLVTPNSIKFPLLEEQGVDLIINERFDKRFASTSRENFVTKILDNHLKIRSIVIGHDFSFGKDVEGDAEYLSSYCKKRGINIIRVKPKNLMKKRISSTLIRDYILKSKFDEVSLFLGRNYSFSGKVVRGRKLGQKIGTPTANINVVGFVVPKYGVYAGIARLGSKRFKAVSYIGRRPTLDYGNPILEIHIFDFKKDIYNKDIEFFFYKFIRPEIKFESEKELVKQMERDLKGARQALNNLVD